MVCFQAMKESGVKWPLITEDDQDRQMKRYVTTVKFGMSVAAYSLTQSRRRSAGNSSATPSELLTNSRSMSLPTWSCPLATEIGTACMTQQRLFEPD